MLVSRIIFYTIMKGLVIRFFILAMCFQKSFCIMTRFLKCVHKNNRSIDKNKLKYVINLDHAICFQNEDNHLQRRKLDLPQSLFQSQNIEANLLN